jgi:hypothetical protein
MSPITPPALSAWPTRIILLGTHCGGSS